MPWLGGLEALLEPFDVLKSLSFVTLRRLTSEAATGKHSPNFHIILGNLQTENKHSLRRPISLRTHGSKSIIHIFAKEIYKILVVLLVVEDFEKILFYI